MKTVKARPDPVPGGRRQAFLVLTMAATLVAVAVVVVAMVRQGWLPGSARHLVNGYFGVIWSPCYVLGLWLLLRTKKNPKVTWLLLIALTVFATVIMLAFVKVQTAIIVVSALLIGLPILIETLPNAGTHAATGKGLE